MAQSQPPVKPRAGPALTPSQLRAERQPPRPKEKPASKGQIDSGTRQVDNRAAPVKNLGGAGGNWRVIDEVADSSVVKQLNELSCGQACVSMMLGDRKISATQDVIAKLAGNGPTYEAQLASVLNKVDSSGARQWIGAGVDAEDLATFHGLTSTGSWAAQFWEKGNKVGHWVVVDGLDDTGRVMIRDPWQATRYKMDLQDFQHTWTGYSVWGQ
jgi:filamentous hemagglutinin